MIPRASRKLRRAWPSALSDSEVSSAERFDTLAALLGIGLLRLRVAASNKAISRDAPGEPKTSNHLDGVTWFSKDLTASPVSREKEAV